MTSPDETHVDQPVRQSRLRAFFRAWGAVCADIPLHLHLIDCKLFYEAQFRWSIHPLPRFISIDNGQIICTPNPDFLSYWERLRDDSTGEQGVPYLSRLEMAEIMQEVQQLEEEFQALTHLMRDLVERIEQQEREAAEAMLRGEEPGERTRACLTRLRSRLRLPFPWLPLLDSLAIFFMGLVEVFQLMWPFLDQIGVDTTALSDEWARNPVAVMGGVASAIVTTVGLMFVWNRLLSNASVLASGWVMAGPFRSGLRLGKMLILCVGLFWGTIAIANLRHGTAVHIGDFMNAKLGQHDGQQTGTSVFLFISFLIPATAAYIHQKIGESPYWQRRAKIQAQHAQWDRDEYEGRLPGARRADTKEFLENKRARIEGEIARLLARRQKLASRVVDAQQEWIRMLDKARQAVELYARTLHAALMQDNNFFRGFAYWCKALHLLPKEPDPGGDSGASGFPTPYYQR